MRTSTSFTTSQYKKNSEPVHKRMSHFLFVFFLIGMLGVGILILRNPKTLPFREVRVISPGAHLSSLILKERVSQFLEGGFFSLNVLRLQKALQSLPWVYKTSFRRIWPDRLEIRIDEQEAIARWGSDQVINRHGELFNSPPPMIPEQLPLLQGPVENLPLLLRYLKDFNFALLRFKTQISTMTLDARGVLKLTLENNTTVLLGREEIQERFSRLMSVYARLMHHPQNLIQSIDLRYPNGFAIKWKDHPVTETNKLIH